MVVVLLVAMGALLQNDKPVTIAGDAYRVEAIAREAFDERWSERWAVEGDCLVNAEDGKLFIRRREVKETGAATVWYRAELPADVMVRFRAKVIEPAGKNMANLNIFLHAREPDGAELRFGRSGKYDEYHAIPNYIVTLVGGAGPGWSRVRRDPGFKLLHEHDVKSQVGREYEIVVTIVNGRLRYYLDGKKIHDVTDPSPLVGGKFAIRTYSTDAWWDDVEFSRIVGE